MKQCIITSYEEMGTCWNTTCVGDGSRACQSVGERNRNVAVQDFDLGLDFSTTPLQGGLAEGAYLAVQIPESFKSIWDWDEWVYVPTKWIVVKKDDQQELIPYNYLVFGVSRYEVHNR